MQRSYGVALLTGALLMSGLAACSGGKSSSSTTSSTTATSPMPSPSSTAAPAGALGKPNATSTLKPRRMAPKGAVLGKPEATVGNGASIFTTNCSSCHQANGKGTPGVFPPLAGNAVVVGNASKVIHIVKNGLTGAVSVNGTTYNGVMPAWKSKLSTADIAHVVSYIRTSWGNHAGIVTTAQVQSTP
jgi:mono/diheme cytochrome c family protein